MPRALNELFDGACSLRQGLALAVELLLLVGERLTAALCEGKDLRGSI